MIQSLTVENYLSFRNETTFSFEATRDTSLEDYHVVEVAPGVRLLKLGVVYGANASGKSNLLSAFEFIKRIWLTTTDSKDENTGAEPFLLDDTSKDKPSYFNLVFFAEERKYNYSIIVDENIILWEKLSYYPTTQPKLIFERKHNEVSEIDYGSDLKLKIVERNEIAVKCISNMSVFAAYNQVNVKVPEIEIALDWMKNRYMDIIEPDMFGTLRNYVEKLISEDEEIKDEILNYLQEADFNISNIHTTLVKQKIPEFIINDFLEESGLSQKEKEKIRKEKSFEIPETVFEHEVFDKDGNLSYYKMPRESQSEGTKRTFELAGPILQAIRRNAFIGIDEIESKLHPRLIEFIIESFVRKSKESQLLVTTHYDGLLDEDDLLRTDNVWFTQKDKSAATTLYPLSGFKALKRISSLLKAYKYGKFGAIPNID